ncbi:MAG: hypothetical protein JNK58_06880 [Phycisphaerae bacterium]|nr:hypothetical protein [Phycisphaerae bacterium]
MTTRSKGRPSKPPTVEQVEALLRAGAATRIEPGTGRVAARVRANLSHTAPSIAVSTGRGYGVASLAAAGLIVATTWMVIGTQRPPPARAPGAMVRLSAAIDHSAAAVRGAKPEQPIMREVKRLKHDVNRGVGFIKAVMPKVRGTG